MGDRARSKRGGQGSNQGRGGGQGSQQGRGGGQGSQQGRGGGQGPQQQARGGGQGSQQGRGGGQGPQQQARGGGQGSQQQNRGGGRGGQKGRPQEYENQPSAGAWGGAPQGAWNRAAPTPAQSSGPAPPQGAWARPQSTPAVSQSAATSVPPGYDPQRNVQRQHTSHRSNGRPEQDVNQTTNQLAAMQVDRKNSRRQAYDIVKSREDGRKKDGNIGRTVKLLTNYWTVNTSTEWTIYNYRVDFKPELDGTRQKKKVFSGRKEKFGQYIFDGSTLLTLQKMKDELFTFTASDDQVGPVEVTIKYIRRVERYEPAFIQVLGIVLRKCLESHKLQLIGRNYYDCDTRDHIRDYKLDIIQGFATSIRQHEDNILLCADLSSRVLRNETALDIIEGIVKSALRYGRNNYQDEVRKELIGTTVLTKYNNKTYRIMEIDFTKSPRSTFETTAGDVTFIDYYRKQYGGKAVIRDLNQPLLVAKAKGGDRRSKKDERCLLVPEICHVTGITDRMRKDYKQMKEITNITCPYPKTRIQKLDAFNSKMLQKETKEIMKDWGMALERKMVEVNGRVIDGAKLKFRNKVEVQVRGADWNNDLIKKAMYTAVNLTNWHLIYNSGDSKLAKTLAQNLTTSVQRMGMEIRPPQFWEVNQKNNGDLKNALRHAKNEDSQMALVLVTSNHPDLYSLIKQTCCKEFPLKTQVVTTKVAAKPAMAISTKIAVQMSCKLGGSPWMDDFPPLTMFIGYDVCHDTKNNKKSFSALVATTKMDEGKYFSVVTEHEQGVELSSNVHLNIMAALRAFRNVNKGYMPGKILFYRDGVGDGQLQQVYETEVRDVRKVLEDAYAKYNAEQKEFYDQMQPPPQNAFVEKKLEMAFIVVTKRINTRIFSQGGDNPEPGTVVDSVITMPERYDFYLVSQKANQGTVSPTSYNVLFDNSKVSPGKLQEVTYRLCHMYYNYVGTIRVPNVCQYAHKLAFLCGQFIHAAPHPDLCNHLFFL